jgi:hypothetical protein
MKLGYEMFPVYGRPELSVDFRYVRVYSTHSSEESFVGNIS